MNDDLTISTSQSHLELADMLEDYGLRVIIDEDTAGEGSESWISLGTLQDGTEHVIGQILGGESTGAVILWQLRAEPESLAGQVESIVRNLVESVVRQIGAAAQKGE